MLMAGNQFQQWAPSPGTTPPGHASPPAARSTVVGRQWGRENQSYVNVVSFGFVASAILISMFLVMAIFERLLRPRSTLQPVLPEPEGVSRRVTMLPIRAQPPTRTLKSDYQLNIAAQGIPVLMPGQDIPSFIARPAPVPATCKCCSALVLGKACPGSSSTEQS